MAASAAALVNRVASLGGGMAAPLLADGRGDRLVRSLARLAHPDDADVFSSQATTGSSNKGPGSSNKGPGSSNLASPSASTDSSNRDAGVESVAALASLAAIPERVASVASAESFEALICRVHAAAAVEERRTTTTTTTSGSGGGDAVIGFAAEDAAHDLAGCHAAAALGSLAYAGVLDRDAALGVLGERAGLLRGIIACAASGNDDDDDDDDGGGVSDRVASFLACAPRVSADDALPPPGRDARASRALHALGSSSRVAARVIVSHPGDACAALARVLLVGDDESRAAAAAAAAALAENVGSGGGYRATMVAAPGLVSGLRSALGGTCDAGGTYAAAALARLAGDGSGEGGGKEAAAAVLGAAPGVVNALARALDNAEAGGDAGGAATCAEALRRLLRCEEAEASEELVRRVNALTMRE